MQGQPIPLNDLRRQNEGMAEALGAAVRRVMQRGWYILGPETQTFERAFADYCGVEHAVGVASGTDAIELALRAARVRRGDAVATVANAGFYTTAAVLAIGAEPRFVDIDDETLLMSVNALDNLLEREELRCVVVTHLYGRLADMDSILAVCEARGVPVIEDCAQAHGTSRNGHKAGSFALAGCFSFYPTKNLGALGDGGAVITRYGDFAQRLLALRQYGWKEKYRVVQPGGRNSRLDELQAAILNAKLPHLDAWNEARRAIARRYSTRISHPKVSCPAVPGEDYVAHLYVVRAKDRDDLCRHLGARNIASDVHYPIPDYRQPGFPGIPVAAHLPQTERAAGEVLTLPCFPEMTDLEVEAVIDAINTW